MKLKQALLVAGLAVATCLAVDSAVAQDNGGNNGGNNGGGRRRGGNFDPQQMQQRMMENLRDQMSVTNDDEWKVIQERVQKVVDTQREAGPGFNMFRLMRRNRGGDNAGGPGGPGGGGGRRGGIFGGTPMPELEALNNALDNKAPTEQVKAAMEKYRAARQAKEEALVKAQSDLQAVLTPRQEAVAVSLGLLK